MDCTLCDVPGGVGWTAYVAGETTSPGRADLARLMTIGLAHLSAIHGIDEIRGVAL